MLHAGTSVPTRPKRRGRTAKSTHLARFQQMFDECMSASHPSGVSEVEARAAIAERLGISTKTLMRFRAGEIRQPRKFTLEQFLEALGVPVDRRKFIELAAKASIGVIVAMHAPPRTLKYRDLHLEAHEADFDRWRNDFLTGADAMKLLPDVQHLHDRLGQHDASHVTRIVVLRIETGLLLANLIEATASWRDKRPREAIRIYNQLDARIFHDERIRQRFAEEYATLVARRAILYREWGGPAQMAQSEAQFKVLEERQGSMRTNLLQTAYRVQRVHYLAVKGDRDAWDAEGREVQDWIKKQRANKDAIEGTFEYILGVGYKRFMWGLRDEEGSPVRLNLARMASERLSSLRRAKDIGAQATKILNIYEHIAEERAALELESAELDAYVWVKPDEACARAHALIPTAQRLYPSIVHKLNDAIEVGEHLQTLPQHRWHFHT